MQRFVSLLVIGMISIFSGRGARQTQQTLFTVLSFQISGYELLLETQQSFQSATNSVKNKVTHARTVLQELFGSSAPGKAETLTTSDETVQEKVDQFRSKLIRLTRCIGMLVGIIVRKILFDIVFGIKQLWRRLHSFVVE